jgi:hypothetical protein
MKKIYSLFILAIMVVLISGIISANDDSASCGYHNHKDCKVKGETIVEGKVTYSETDDLAKKAEVTVTCTHDGTDYTKTTKSGGKGIYKGTYIVTFPQKHCIEGDSVVVVAVKNGLSGTSEGIVTNFIEEECLNLDIAIVDVALVPEFGVILGTLTVLGALGMFFVVRRK